tara:strand:- start:243 stop:428 length:186 start_codon:yes stop_codon:yes gene_type:complete
VKKYWEALLHPLTQINLLIVGFLLLIEIVHTKAHHSYEVDVHGYVHQFIQKNPDACPESDW